ncbi:MAG: hypothetical protein CL851_06755 [Crocinitomicaceae bacterium]|nr:hypothetical protein [Crocinitomicaceae bacterium]|tara:strand:- start:3319 stop:4146 length:828 start_codon:yes stop_codon:yes gene_type:complete
MTQIKSLVKIGLIAFILALTSALWAKYIATQWFASDATVELNTDFADKLNSIVTSNPLSLFLPGASQISSSSGKIKKKLLSRPFLLDLEDEYILLPEIYSKDWNKIENEWKGGNIKDIEDLRSYLSINLYVEDDIESGFVDISILTNDKYLSQKILSALIDGINSFEKEKFKISANKVISAAIDKLNKKNNTSFNNETYSRLIETESRKLLLSETQDDYYLKVLDPPNLAKFKAKPKARSYFIVTFALSFGFTVLYQNRKKIIELIKNDLLGKSA